MSFTINFVNYGRGLEDGTYVYRSESPIPDSPLPAPIATLAMGATQFVDTTAEYGKMYYYRFGAFLGSDIVLSRNRALRVLAASDTGPGPQTLAAGDWRLGFFGWVPSADVITINALNTKFGMTGTAGAEVGWLKVARNGKVLFVSQGPAITNTNYAQLYNKGLVYGTNDNGLCVPTGSSPTNQYKPFSQDGIYTFIPRIWQAHPAGSALLNAVNTGSLNADYRNDSTVPITPQTKGTEFDEIMACFNNRPLFIGDDLTCRFGFYGYDMYKTDSATSSTATRQSDLCQQPSGTVDKSKVNTRGTVWSGYDYYNTRPAMHGIAQVGVTVSSVTDAQIVGTSAFVYTMAWRPILELDI